MSEEYPIKAKIVAKIAVGEQYDVTIEKIIYGGEGLARIGVFTIFVPYTAPGDRVRIRIVSVERKFARGVIDELLEPATVRREPPCRYFGTCGGCQLQHLPYTAQLEVKVGFIRESLRRLGGIDWSATIRTISGAELGYRSRAELKIARDIDGRPHFGYFESGSQRLCEVDSCPILHPLAERQLQQLRNRASELDPNATRVYLTVGDDGALATPATGENSRSAEVDSRGTIEQKIGGLTYRFGVRSFFQGNRLLVEDLVTEAIGGSNGRRAVDLYAGVGLFSLQLAGRFDKVCAVEGNRIAAAHGSNNAWLNGIYNLQYDPLSVESWLRHRTAGWERPDLLLLDPPRAGAGTQVMERIAELAPTKISYVSCDPATLARDLRVLVAAGYQIRSVTAVDMFPQTYHVETVVHLGREPLKS